ncbi:PREDICTED: probable RNA-binding protein 46 [Nicrophorus vespilloides]|uniref:Probable RNA-binding protein 46 n=1 Tax=Nicrophorus vespilloides TaxID=110193 RepID=A0ABM1MCH4_NICVS|nr:PREDICTED: probable RNA-binding protein 46 [Nicrophorus vespilloides]
MDNQNKKTLLDVYHKETKSQKDIFTILEFIFGKKFTTINGQRIFAPRSGETKNVDTCEVFVCQLPRNIFEDKLLFLFSAVGPIQEMRLMLEFSGYNRGFCYVVYETPELARIAIEFLHGLIYFGNKLSAYASVDNRKLKLTKLPMMITDELIRVELRTKMEDVVSIEIYYENCDRTAVVKFLTHGKAMKVRKQFWPNNLLIWGQRVNLDWCKPERSMVLRAESSLLISNLPLYVSERSVLKFVARIVKKDGTVMEIKKLNGNSFVIEFLQNYYARKAFALLEGTSYGNKKLSIAWKTNFN